MWNLLIFIWFLLFWFSVKVLGCSGKVPWGSRWFRLGSGWFWVGSMFYIHVHPTSTVVELLQRTAKRKNNDQTNLNKEGIFQLWKVFYFVRYDLHVRDLRSNITFVWFGWYRKYKEGTKSFQKRLNTRLISSVIATADNTFRFFDFSHKIFSWFPFKCRLASHFELFQLPPVSNWNYSFTYTHMELQDAA